MLRFVLILSLLLPLSQVFCSPIKPTPVPVNPRDTIQTRGWDWKLEDLQDEFPGIWWGWAFKDCEDEQLDKIIFATRYAMHMLDNVDLSYPYGKAFGRYFMPYSNWLAKGQAYLNLASQIQSNIIQVKRFPKAGKGKRRQAQRVTYSCKQLGGVKPCGKTTAAMTYSPDLVEDFKWVIVFCPYFFTTSKLMYLEERTNGKPKPASELFDLGTYESTIIHEFMHVDLFGYKEHIIDINSTLTKGDLHSVSIYSESRCHEYSKKYWPHPNAATVINADSYAWFFTYAWFDKKWSWTANGQFPPDRRDLPDTLRKRQEDQEEEEDDGNVPSFPGTEDDIKPEQETLPENCQILSDQKDEEGNDVVQCDYVGEDYDQWVAELPKPFESQQGCELSPECHKSAELAVNPKCNCKCDGHDTPLTDSRCIGFAGDLTEGGPPLVSKSKAVSIILQQISQEGEISNVWTFFQTDIGKPVDGCTEPILQDDSRRWGDNDAINTPPWPHGTFTMKLFGEDNCQYLSDGTNPGILHCPSMSENVSCSEDNDKSSPPSITQCIYSTTVSRAFHRVAYCEW